MTDQEIKVIQSQIFEIFKQFHKICEQNNLVYYIIGGTMLGAVRHRGFIPWDDDMDVGMPRKDYEKFTTIINKSMKDGLYIDNDIVDTTCARDFSKLAKKATVGASNLTIFLDIFPLDGAPSREEKEIKKYYKKINNLRLMKNSYFMTLEGKNIIKRSVIRLLRLVPLSTYRKILNKQLKKYDFYCSPAGGTYFGYPHEIIPIEFYGKPTLVFFEDGYYWGVEDPDKYLTALYGDYMTIPPIEERQSHFD